MEMKYVVPDMAQSFGTLEFAGESEPIFERDKNNRKVIARRSYNLYSDIQKGENVVVEIPVQAGEKHFKYEQKVKLVNPKLYPPRRRSHHRGWPHQGRRLRAAPFQQPGPGQGHGYPPPRLPRHRRELRRHRHRGQRGDRHHLDGEKRCTHAPL